MLLKISNIPWFGELYKKIKIQVYREKMRFPTKPSKRMDRKLKPSPLQPVLPLIPEALPTKDQDKSKFVTFELKVRAGQPAGSTNYKKFVRVFEEGTPQQWIDLVRDLEEIWVQNSVNGPSDRTATIRSLLKGESLTAFDTALEDARVDPNPNNIAPLALTAEQIGTAMDSVATTVFPHRALEIQRLWMNRGMKKPVELSTRKTAAAISRINNCLPLFPLGNQDSKFSDQELVGLLEWSLPQAWRKKFDLDGYVPTLGTKAKLILECEAIERNEVVKDDNKYDHVDANKIATKIKFNKSGGGPQKNERADNGYYFCKTCGRNRTHGTATCYYNKDKTQRFEKKDGERGNDNNGKPNRPFSRRTFRKEINVLARKAGKKKVLDVYAAALKREQVKVAKSKKTNKKNRASDDSSASSDSTKSVNNLERAIPRKQAYKKAHFKDVDNKNKYKKDKYVPLSDDEEEFLDNVKNMQLEDDYEMIDSDDDVLSIGSNESI